LSINRAARGALLFILLGVAPVRAQVVDTVAVDPAAVDSLLAAPSDSAGVRPDSLRAPVRRALDLSRLVPFASDNRGITVHDSLPALLPDREAADQLAREGGSFLYDFGGPGWPDGWSPLGLNPRQVGLQVQGIDYTDPITGRPLLEILPMAWLDPLRLQPGRLGRAASVGARLRAYDSPRPISEIRYGSSKDGLQSVLVLHAQRRRVRFVAEPGLLSFALGYGGHGADGEYPGSKLTSGRQLLARLRLQQSFGSLEIVNLQNRQRLGAHGGVIPFGADYTTIYARIGAQVENESAQRAIIHNDLIATLRASLIPGWAEPFEATGYWTAQTFRYAFGSDTLSAVTRRLGYRLLQPLVQAGAFEADARAEGWTERLAESTVFPDSLDLRRRNFHAGAYIAYRRDRLEMTADAGFHVVTDDVFPGGAARAEWQPAEGFRIFAEASRAGQTASWIDHYGWDGRVTPLESIQAGRTTMGRAGVGVTLGVFDVSVSPFGHQTVDAFDLFERGGDSVDVRLLDAPVRWVGVSTDLGFRREAVRGFYLTLSPTVYRYAGDTATSDARRVAASLPEVFVRGRSGLRYLLFRGDLEMDLYVQARLWTPFRSRALHPQTGLLALPAETGREVLGSLAADVVLEAGVRTATIFVAFDNVLSGSGVIPGNMLVPDYPLPQQRFRLGVYWPIFD